MKRLSREDMGSCQIKFANEIGIEFEASAAWRIFRCRANDENSQRVNRLHLAISMFSSGKYSVREVASVTGYSKVTANSILHKIRAIRQKSMLPEICCPCGNPLVEHKGWCSYRFSKSEKRQDFLNSLQKKQRLRLETTFPLSDTLNNVR